MSKFWLVTKREYLSRVRKKTFILATVLTPIGFLIFWVAMILIMTSGSESRRMALLDDADVLQLSQGRSMRDGIVTFVPMKMPLDSLKQNLDKYDLDGILYLSADKNQNITDSKVLNLDYYAKDKIGVGALSFIKDAFDDHIRELKITASGIDKNILNNLKTSVTLIPKQLDDSTTQEESSYRVYVATFLGGIMMFLIYIVIFIYGNMVMRSVMEEKTSRIVEVIISSIKPFQLMLGKIVGVGMVGLTQFAIWAVIFPLLYLLVGLLFAGRLQALQQSPMMGQQGQPSGMEGLDPGEINQALAELGSFNYGYIIVFFILFFICGYLLYASLFAAIGAAMGDDWGEGQSLTLVVAIPVIIAFYMGVAVVENPNGTLGFWASLIPLFSPIIMPARIVFDPPIWQILLSLALLIGTCLFFVWMSGRIYRVGILMYGKKTTVKELFKWIFRKD